MAKETQSVQIVAYAAGPIAEDAGSLWREYVKSPIKHQGSSVGASSFVQGAQSEFLVNLSLQTTGITQPGVLQMLGPFSQGGRADLIFLPSRDATLFSLPGLDRSAALAVGLPVMKQIAQRLSATRVAIVVQVSELVRDAEEAGQRLRQYVPAMPVPRGVQDISFQVASGRSSTTNPAALLMRICRWSSAIQASVVISQSSLDGQVTQPVQHIVAAEYIDVGTPPNSTPLAPESIDSLFDEIANDVEGVLVSGFSYLG